MFKIMFIRISKYIIAPCMVLVLALTMLVTPVQAATVATPDYGIYNSHGVNVRGDNNYVSYQPPYEYPSEKESNPFFDGVQTVFGGLAACVATEIFFTFILVPAGVPIGIPVCLGGRLPEVIGPIMPFLAE